MTCHCRNAVTTEIRAVPGDDSVAVDRHIGIVTVSATAPVDRTDIAAAVDAPGYTLRP
jgi:copper chaperone CopZ